MSHQITPTDEVTSETPGRSKDDGTDTLTQAGAPQRQDQSHSSLDTTSESGRARDEGRDGIERTQAQGKATRPGPDAVATSKIDPTERETL